MAIRLPQRRPDERARELAILNSVAEALNSSTDVRQALERTLELVSAQLGLQTGWVWLRDPETQHFYLAAARNLPPFLQEPVRMSGEEPCICTVGFQHGDLTPSNIEVLQCSRLMEAFAARVPEAALGLRFHASIPLYFQDRPLGIMNVTGPRERKLTEAELRLLATIAYQVGIAVERARLAEESTRLARAEERARIAREIHDTIAQDLTAVALDIEGALRHVDEHPERARERLERALATTREGLEEARHAVLDLRSGPPGGRPLPEALAALTRSFTADTGVQVYLSCLEVPPLPLRFEAELYRVVQETLSNVRKHAHAGLVQIDLGVAGETLVLTVRDDGQGFDANDARGDGHGLEGMRERVKLLSGRMRVASRPGLGTHVSVRVPLPAGDPRAGDPPAGDPEEATT